MGETPWAATSAGYYHPAKRFAGQPSQFDVFEEAMEEETVPGEPGDAVSLANKGLWNVVNVDQGQLCHHRQRQVGCHVSATIQFLTRRSRRSQHQCANALSEQPRAHQPDECATRPPPHAHTL